MADINEKKPRRRGRPKGSKNKKKTENTKNNKEINEEIIDDNLSDEQNINELTEEELIAKNIEEAILNSQQRIKLYVVYDESLNKWKAIKEKGRRAVKMANTRTGLIKEIMPIVKKENFELVVLNKKDILTKYKEIKK